VPLTMEMALRDGAAALRDRADRVERSIAADAPHSFVRQPGSGMNFCGLPGCSRTIAEHEAGWTDPNDETRSRIAAWRRSADALEAFAMARELPKRSRV